ncbi:hypothetical protein HYV43_03975 [Candidatus Micrarchaeota archaeon]|nr:hypothetical protein [Candidatus Micrarchaeota archaeon]
MSKLELVRIDSRGRIVLPQHFRELLGLHEDDSAYVTLDEQNHRIWISPAAEKNLVNVEIMLEDEPGSLAQAATVLARLKVDLVSTESHSTLRGKQAAWRIIAKDSRSPSQLKAELEKHGVKVKSARRF